MKLAFSRKIFHVILTSNWWWWHRFPAKILFPSPVIPTNCSQESHSSTRTPEYRGSFVKMIWVGYAVCLRRWLDLFRWKSHSSHLRCDLKTWLNRVSLIRSVVISLALRLGSDALDAVHVATVMASDQSCLSCLRPLDARLDHWFCRDQRRLRTNSSRIRSTLQPHGVLFVYSCAHVWTNENVRPIIAINTKSYIHVFVYKWHWLISNSVEITQISSRSNCVDSVRRIRIPRLADESIWNLRAIWPTVAKWHRRLAPLCFVKRPSRT